MRSPRFYVPQARFVGETFALPPAVAHHARRVLRLRPGERLVLFDGAGREFDAVLLGDAAGAGPVAVRLEEERRIDREAPLHITLVQALCAQDKLEWVLEKCVELGAARLVVAPSARSVVRLSRERGPRRLERWREIVVAACCQCGRNRVPELELAADWRQALRHEAGAELRCLLDPEGPRSLPRAAAGSSVALVVGPEGGFTPEESEFAQELGYLRVRLGPRVLRTETAALAAISALLAGCGGLEAASAPGERREGAAAGRAA